MVNTDHTDMTRGFVTVATGRKEYYKLASNLLASYKYHTAKPMRWAILCDEENEYTRQFDDVVLPQRVTRTVWDKFLPLENVPYDEYIYIDADCLAYRDLNGLWDIFRDASYFSCLGALMPLDSRDGWFDPSHLGEFSDRVDYQITMQGGIMFFRNGPELDAFAAMCHHIYEHIFDYNFRLLSDETIYALASAYYGLKPAKNWTDVFCFLPEAEIIDADILKGKLKFRWKRFASWRPIYGKYLVHWTTEGTRGDLYRREAAALEPVAAQGRHAPFAVRLRIKAVSLRCYLTEHLTPAVPESLKGIIVRFWSKLHKQ